MTDQNIGISYQSLSRGIYAGRLNKARTLFLGGKRKVTNEAVAAVCMYVLHNHPDGMRLTYDNGTKGWEIDVREISDGAGD